MGFRETVNQKGVRLDAMKLTVVDSRYEASGGPQVGNDIIVLLGFLPGDHNTYASIPVVSVDQVIADCVDITDDEAVKEMRASSMFKALVSCRMNGGSDIILFKLGTLAELEVLSEDDRMQLLYDRLAEGLPIAADNDWYDYLVPVDAPAEGYTKADDSVLDYLSLLAQTCAQAMSYGLFLQGMLSTSQLDGTIWMTSESLRLKEDWQFRDSGQSYAYSPTLGWIPGNDRYRFVAVPTGKGLFSSFEHDAFFEHGFAPAVAGRCSSLPSNVSIVGRELNVSEVLGPVLGSMADDLSVIGYIPIGQSALMRRRKVEGALVLSDSTMAVPASDFRQEVTLRLARRVSKKVRLALEPLVGSNGTLVDVVVERTMDELKDSKEIMDYKFSLKRDTTDRYKVRLFLEIVPYGHVKAIEISIVTGPFVS